MAKKPITQADFDTLVAEIKNLRDVERPAIIQAIQDARSNGDLKENADYHASREKQGEIETRISYLENLLSNSEIMDFDTKNAPNVVFGAKVSVKNHTTGKQQTYTIVSPDAVDPMAGKISNTSPIGAALIGKKRGEKVDVQTPRGVATLEVLDYE